MALSALLIWFVLMDRLFILYATLLFLQALYIAYLSGQGFDWPWLSYARPLTSFAWNVPVSLSGAVACLFTREIADLKHFSPRIYTVFGWFAWASVTVTLANLAKLVGFGIWVSASGNLLFIATSIFTLVVSFLAWRRGNRAVGWFLIAWVLLEGFTITAAVLIALGGGGPLACAAPCAHRGRKTCANRSSHGCLESPLAHRTARSGVFTRACARPADRTAVQMAAPLAA